MQPEIYEFFHTVGQYLHDSERIHIRQVDDREWTAPNSTWQHGLMPDIVREGTTYKHRAGAMACDSFCDSLG